MSELELQNKDKTVSKMTRDGLIEENISQGTSTRVSERKADSDWDNKETETKQEYRREEFQRNHQKQEDKKKEDKKQEEKGKKGENDKTSKKSKEKKNQNKEEGAKTDTKKSNEDIKYSKKTQKVVVRASRAEEKKDTRYEKIPKKKRLCFEDKNDKYKNTEFLGSAHIVKNRLKFENRVNRKGNLIFNTSYRGKKANKRRAKQIVAGRIESKFFEEEESNVGVKGSRKVYRTAKIAKRTIGRVVRKQTDPVHKYRRSVKKFKKKNAQAAYLKFLDENRAVMKGYNKNSTAKAKGIFKKHLQKRRFKRKFAEAYKKTANSSYAASFAQASAVKASRRIAETIAKIRKVLFAGGASTFLILIIMLLFLFLAMAAAEFLTILTTVSVSGVYPGENLALSDTDGYYTELEADLDNEIKGIEEKLPGYDEYQYHLDHIEHDQIALLSYLSIKFEDFTLSEVQPELDSIFAEQYELEVKEEMQIREREVEYTNIITGGTETKIEQYEYWILHITLTNNDFESILLNRLTDEEKERYEIYLDTGGARQVFSSPFDFDWSGDISSPFGWRIHPISHQKKFHTGVDIAEPGGTPIMAVMSGTVVISRYSDSAGNYIVIQDKDGYMTKYMHCTKLFVSEGAQVVKGDVIATVGTTGNSTGNHLHLDVIDPGGNYLNPVLMVSTANYRKEEE